jgi:hypothetical protein
MAIRLVSVLVSFSVACANAVPSGDPPPGNEPDPDAATGGVDTTTVDPPDSPPTSSCSQPFSGELAAWSFTGAAGSQASTAPSSTAPGVTADPIARAATLTAVSGSGSINASNWAIAAQRDATRFFTFSVSPPAGCTLRVDSISIDTTSSGTGPASAVIATSADNFAQTTTLTTNMASSPALAVTATGPLEIRVYGFGATAVAGTMRIRTALAVNGALE